MASLNDSGRFKKDDLTITGEKREKDLNYRPFSIKIITIYWNVIVNKINYSRFGYVFFI